MLVGSTDRLLEFLFDPINEVDLFDKNLGPVSRLWNRIVCGRLGSAAASTDEADGVAVPARVALYQSRIGKLVLWCFPILGLIQVLCLFSPTVAVGAADVMVAQEAFDSGILAGLKLPQSLNGWECVEQSHEQRDIGHEDGQFSAVWFYDSGGHQCRYSVDYPFFGWHELTACYEGQGWRVDSRRSVETQTGGHVEACLSKPTGEHAVLLFAVFSNSGQPLAPSVAANVGDKLDSHPLLGWLGGDPGLPVDGLSIQVQLFMPSDHLAVNKVQPPIRELFEMLTGHFLAKFLGSPAVNSATEEIK